MSAEKPTRTYHIVIALDGSALGQAALEAARWLATPAVADLRGVFVEDINLVRLAGLPFVAEVEYSSARLRSLQGLAIERAFQSAAGIAERALAELARQLRLEHSFHVARGAVARESLQAGEAADLLIVGRQARSVRPGRRRPHGGPGPVVVVSDRAASDRALLTSVGRLARQLRRSLFLLRPGAAAHDAALTATPDVRESPATVGRDRDLVGGVARQLTCPADKLVDTLQHEMPGIVVLDRQSFAVTDELLDVLINTLNCPIVVVRSFPEP